MRLRADAQKKKEAKNPGAKGQGPAGHGGRYINHILEGDPYLLFPEVDSPPELLEPAEQKKYVKKYLSPVDLTRMVEDFQHHALDAINNWKIHEPRQLLNSHKTKFLSRTNPDVIKEKYITLEFTEPIEVHAFGFQAANDFPHLDPQEMLIEVTVADDKLA